MSSTIEFWFDPVCPWAWLTSRWIHEVSEHKQVSVQWRIFNLGALNEGSDVPPEYQQALVRSWQLGRVLMAASAQAGDGVLSDLYTALGTRIHLDQRSDSQADTEAVIAESLRQVGLDPALAEQALNDSWDEQLRQSTKGALALVGNDVGTPIIAVDGVAFFGPVIAAVPRGQQAVRLWDATIELASFPAFFELKRSRTQDPQFD